ncbi:MAG: 16S rRNA (adenine(1518)-N(6)/adenine(1519)-N(6))-dimethyltransferase, partial [Clostridiaceae bacterium]|nr:16S rRNA (adenine(1518)-N(6)/adenine(1519)-N(6))-dimethyltransferase [Clostridiaceae bacterium]
YVNYRYAASFVAHVPPESFIPSPKVTSTVLKFIKRDKPLVDVPSEEFFFSVVRASFSQRRKKLSNCISSMSSFNVSKEDVEQILSDIGLRTDIRAESLSIQKFAELAWKLHSI